MAKGSNKSLPSPKQTITVKPKKDKLAGNVGGKAHMSAGDKPNMNRNVMKSVIRKK